MGICCCLLDPKLTAIKPKSRSVLIEHVWSANLEAILKVTLSGQVLVAASTRVTSLAFLPWFLSVLYLPFQT